jgi:hypothetical protein
MSNLKHNKEYRQLINSIEILINNSRRLQIEINRIKNRATRWKLRFQLEKIAIDIYDLVNIVEAFVKNDRHKRNNK